MLDKNMKKEEIEKELNGKGDFVQLDWINRLLKESVPLAIKKLLYLRLAEIYARKSMPLEEARMYDNVAILCSTFSEKMKFYVREAKVLIKSMHFEKVEPAIKKAMSQANASERNEISIEIKNEYKKQAENLILEKKKNAACKMYEKLLETNISDLERTEIKTKLKSLCDDLGKKSKSVILK